VEIPAAGQSEQALLGTGYDVFKEEFVGQCVRGTTAHAGRPESFINFDRSLTESAVADQLGLQVGVKVRYGLFSGGLAAQFASESAASEFSDVTTYSHHISFQNHVMQFPGVGEGLTPQGLAAKGTGDTPFVSDNWKLTCGHEFVSQITLGAKLFVSIKVEFATREDKQNFTASVSFQGPPVDVKASLQLASQRFGKRASVSISGYQLGGEPGRLARVFGASEGGTAPIVSASLNNPEAVVQVLDAVVSYSTADFPNQVDPSRSPNTPGGPAFLSYITSPYAELGLFASPPIIEEATRQARSQLSELFERNAKHQQRLTRLLTGPIRLSTRQLERLDAIQRSVAQNLSLITEAAVICYTSATDGPAAVARVAERLEQFDSEEFEVRPESFAQWYDAKDLPGTLAAERAVVESLVNTVRNDFVDFEQIIDKGLAVQERIDTLETLIIDEQLKHLYSSDMWSIMTNAPLTGVFMTTPVETLEPLRMLRRDHLEAFTASEVSTSDLTPLKDFPSLTALELRSAPIRDLSDFAQMSQLEHLAISDCGPGASDLAPLANLTRLEVLDLRNNGVTDLVPLRGMLMMRSLTLSENPIASIEPLRTMTRLERLRVGPDVRKLAEVETILRDGVSIDAAAIRDLKLLTDLPVVDNLFIADDAIRVTLSAGWEGLWQRRRSSSAFDTTWTLASTGENFSGHALLTFVGLVSPETFLPDSTVSDDSLAVTVLCNLPGMVVSLRGVVSADRRAVEQGAAGSHEDGSADALLLQPSHQWSAVPA
jgi:hypothetical protein